MIVGRMSAIEAGPKNNQTATMKKEKTGKKQQQNHTPPLSPPDDDERLPPLHLIGGRRCLLVEAVDPLD